MTRYAIPASPSAICGPGAREELIDVVGARAGDVLLVSDVGLAETPVLNQVLSALPADTKVTTYLLPSGEPSVAAVDQGAEQARQLETPLVIGVGGGSALDTAKLIAALQKTGDSVASYTLGQATFEARASAVMVPTTAGTGSEMTRTCIVADEDGRKLWAFADALLPDVAVVDAELCAGLPPAITVTTGLDAFVHGLEAATAQNATSMSRALGTEAMRLARRYLGRAAGDGGDLEARQSMLEASMLAGAAINGAGTGLAHNIGHALGSLYHAPHGLAVAIGLDASIDWIAEVDGPGLASARDILDDGGSQGGLPAAFRTWLDTLGFDQILAEAGLPVPSGPELSRAMAADENKPMAANSARRPSPDDINALARTTCHRWLTRTERRVSAE